MIHFRLVSFIFAFCLCAKAAFALSASEAMDKSKAWFKSAKAWSLDFKLQVFYADSPNMASQQGSLVVADKDRFKLDIAGIKFYSDGESLWQHNVEQKQVLIKAVEDLSSSLHPSELLFKYLGCNATAISEGVFQKQNLWVLKLDPSKYKGQFTQMEVWLSQKDFSPVRLFTVDPEGNGSWYNITNLKVVKKVSIEDFRYKPIKDVDEIDMR
ncbi:MAG: outer membrane lipoprotein carrier protein LolA [Fibrobacter sp.]|nr:outer membrane lipoprotein carrier protein LolA [Fibrobacter sp.]